MTRATLRNHTCKDLAQMAKKKGIPGWHAMRKDQLVQALLERQEKNKKKKSARQSKAASQKTSARRRSSTSKSNGATKRKSATSRKGAASAKSNGKATGGQASTNGARKRSTSPRARKKINQFQEKLQRAKDLTTPLPEGKSASDISDRVVVMVRDPYWLHAYWELTRQSVARAQAAMGQNWHTARPQLRLYEVNNNSASTGSDRHVRSIEIHGGVNNWYIDVQDPPKSYRVEIGYQSSGGEFHPISRSNVVTTPPAAARDAMDENWLDVAENVDRIYALSGGYSPEGTNRELRELLEERLCRPMGSPVATSFGAAAPPVDERGGEFHLEVDAELIVFGFTRPGAHVVLKGEPVQLRSDGSFAVRLNLTDCRQVIPVVASSRDGVEQRTIALAVERNTKRMETVIRDRVS